MQLKQLKANFDSPYNWLSSMVYLVYGLSITFFLVTMASPKLAEVQLFTRMFQSISIMIFICILCYKIILFIGVKETLSSWQMKVQTFLPVKAFFAFVWVLNAVRWVAGEFGDRMYTEATSDPQRFIIFIVATVVSLISIHLAFKMVEQ